MINERIQLKIGKPNAALHPALKTDILSQYVTVKQYANQTLEKSAQIAAKTIRAPKAAVCWVSDSSVRLIATYGLGTDQLARSLPKDFTWFAPEQAMFSSQSSVLSPIQAFLGIDDQKFVVTVPLYSKAGYVMGSILILDQQEQQLEAFQLEVLTDIANLSMETIHEALAIQNNQSIPKATSSFGSLDQAVMQANESIIIFDLQGSITHWNQGACQMYGYAADNMIGHQVFTIVPPDDHFSLKRLMLEVQQKAVAPRLVTRLHQSGFRIQLRSSLQPVRNAAGEVIGILEISGLAAEPIQATTIERFQNLVQHLPMLFMQTNAIGILTFIEGSLLNEYSRDSEDLMGLSVFQVFADQTEIQQAMRLALTGESVHQIVSWREKQYEFWIVPVTNQNRVLSCQVLAVDISQQIQTKLQLEHVELEKTKSEETLLEVSSRIEQLLDSLPILAIALDAKGCITLLEGKGIKHFGGEENLKHILGQSLVKVLPDEPIIENLVESALAGDEFNVSFDFRGLTVEVFVQPIRKDSIVIGANAIVLDLSESSKVMLEKRLVSEKLVQTQAALAQQQAFAQMVLETIEQGVTVNNEKGVFEYVSPVYAKMLGYEPEELIGISPTQLVTNPELVKESLAERNDGWTGVHRYEAIRKDGSLIAIEVTSYPRLDRYGQVKGGGIGLVRDISLQVEHSEEIAMVQKRLDQEREFALKVTSTVSEGLVTIDANGDVIYANQTIIDMVNCKLEDLIGTQAMLLAPESERAVILEQHWKKIIKGESRTYQHSMIPRHGETRQVEVTVYPIFNEQKRFSGSVLYVKDLTKQIEQNKEIELVKYQLEQERDYALTIAQSIQSALIITNNQLQFEYINPAMTTIFGYTLEDVHHKTPKDLVHPDDYSQLEQAIRERIGQSTHYRFRAFHKDGHEIHIEGYSTIRLNAKGEMIGSISVMEDITEQLALEKASHQVRRALERESRNAVLVAEAIPDGLLFISPQNIIEYANPAALKILGNASLQKVVGQPSKTWVIPENQELLRFESALVREGQKRSFQLPIKRANNEMIMVQAYGYPRMEKNQFTGSIVILRDLSAEIQQQENVRELSQLSSTQAKRLELIDTIRNDAAKATTTQDLIKNIVQSISQNLGVPLVSIYLLEEDHLVLQHAVGYKKTIAKHAMTGKGVMVRTIKNNQIYRIDDASTEPDFVHLSGEIRSELCVPITHQNQVLGVINLESRELAAFNESDASLLLQIAERISDKIQMTNLLEEMRLLEQLKHHPDSPTKANQILLPNIKAALAFMHGVGGQQMFTAHLEEYADLPERKLVLRGRGFVIVVLEGTVKQYFAAIKS
jgi:PAS domain S-box-containing protein